MPPQLGHWAGEQERELAGETLLRGLSILYCDAFSVRGGCIGMCVFVCLCVCMLVFATGKRLLPKSSVSYTIEIIMQLIHTNPHTHTPMPHKPPPPKHTQAAQAW
jgi:hypothetical protein